MTTKQSKDENRKTVGEWLSLPFEWRIPVYQRHYAWNAEMESGPVHLFWSTVEEHAHARLNGEPRFPHYLGAVLVEPKTAREATIMQFDVVDGQQRLTTIQIALLALIRISADYNCASEIKDALGDYIFIDYKSNDRPKPRLHLTNLDNKQFEKVVFDAYDIILDVGLGNTHRENAHKSKIVSTFEFFLKKYKGVIDDRQEDPETVIRIIKDTLIESFHIVRIVLDEKDESQTVFESLNNYSERLTTFDLIRNNVFHRASKTRSGLDEELFYKPNWQEIERPYWEKPADKNKNSPTKHIEAYISRMLVANVKKAILFNTSSIFATYKADFQTKYSSVEEEIRAFVGYVEIYKHLDSPSEFQNPNSEVDLGVFKYTTWNNRDYYPVLFCIMGSNANNKEKQKMVSLMESYVIRRGVCKLSLSNYNKHAVRVCKALGDDMSYGALRKSLMEGKGDSVVFPDDENVKASCVRVPFYGSPFQNYVFKEIEKSLKNNRDESEIVEEGLSIDHILPQKWHENQEWQKALLSGVASSVEKRMVIDSNIDVIGNLTIMSGRRNSAKSNRSWKKVKELLSDSTLKLNRELGEMDGWDVTEIAERSRVLADKICEIWPYDLPDK